MKGLLSAASEMALIKVCSGKGATNRIEVAASRPILFTRPGVSSIRRPRACLSEDLTGERKSSKTPSLT